MTLRVIAEGATERQVGLVLYSRGLLQAVPYELLRGQHREGYDSVIGELRGPDGLLKKLQDVPDLTKVLLIFDQESAPTPQDRALQIAQDLRWSDPFWSSFSFQAVGGCNNLFENSSPQLQVVLHISSPTIVGIPSRTFDGYILQLLQGPAKAEIARALAPQGADSEALLHKAERELTEMMNRNGFPWTHAKSWLYAYITVFQFRQSHVWFAEEVVRKAPEDELRRVFAPLIAAWNRLATSP